jgi:hypothetical protein
VTTAQLSITTITASRTSSYAPKKVVTVSDTLKDALWNGAEGLGSLASMTYVFVKDWRGEEGGGGK